MIGLKNATAALGFAMALGLAVAAASPALAKERMRANHPGHARGRKRSAARLATTA